VLIAVVGGWIIFRLWADSTITVKVNSDAVIFDQRILRRSDFHGFCVESTLEDHGQALSAIGYTYGARTFKYGGFILGQRKAMELVAGLNSEMRIAPAAGEQKQLPAAQLRNVRQTDF
jgi:hypothetical protein